MDNNFFKDANETLIALIAEMGTDLAVWGAINLIESYEQAAEGKVLAEECRQESIAIGWKMEQLDDDYERGKISAAQYNTMFLQYEAEQNALAEEKAAILASIETFKKESVKQFQAGIAAVGLSSVIQ